MRTKRWLGALAAVGLCALHAAGCGGTVETERSTGPVAIEAYQAELGRAVCDQLAGCCQSGVPLNRDKCRTGFANDVSRWMVSQPEFYDAVAARKCIDVVASAAATCGVQEQWDAWASAECLALIDPRPTQVGDLVGFPHTKLGEACDNTCGATACSPWKPPTRDVKPRACWLSDGLACGADQTCVPAPQTGDACRWVFECPQYHACEEGRCVVGTRTGACSVQTDCYPSSTCVDGQCRPRKLDTPDFCAGDD